jgi:hypothetical protein
MGSPVPEARELDPADRMPAVQLTKLSPPSIDLSRLDIPSVSDRRDR